MPPRDAKGRPSAGPARGLLRQLEADGTIEHRRLLPSVKLSAFVAHFWWVRWELASPFLTETLPHPSVHVVFESPGARVEVTGVATKRFSRTLSGTGRAFGIKFRPATFHPLAGVSLATLRDRTLPAARVLGELGDRLARTVDEPMTLEEAIVRAEEVLEPALPPLPVEVQLTRDIVERMETDRAILRVEDAADRTGLAVRTLERRFRTHVGVSPKWVILRYRLMEAVEQLKQGGNGSLADLAASLGYFDQSHFVRDFKAMVGRTPSGFSAGRPSNRPKRPRP